MRKSTGFTLIELVIVIAIIGILASLSIPKYIDMSEASKQAAMEGGLGTIRSALATRYAASATGGAVASYPTYLAASDFANGELPFNRIVPNLGTPGVVAVDDVPPGAHPFLMGNNPTCAGAPGYWYVSDPAAGENYGQVGYYDFIGAC
jgi:prepilin-type N-terminal cleavage/methylation domain-containing protein